MKIFPPTEPDFSSELHDPRRRKEHLAASDHAEPPIFVSAVPKRQEPRSAVSVVDATQPRLGPTGRIEPLPGTVEEAYRALVLGTRDYVRKNGFTDAVIVASNDVVNENDLFASLEGCRRSLGVKVITASLTDYLP